MVDTDPSSVPAELQKQIRLVGAENSGIYPIILDERLSVEVRTGSLPVPVERAEVQSGSLHILVKRYDLPWLELVARLSLGCLYPGLDLKYPDSRAPFWNPHLIRGLGVTSPDRRYRRWISALEMSPHVDKAAWDERAIPIRVGNDLRRDFILELSFLQNPVGHIITGRPTPVELGPVTDRLQAMASAADGLELLLRSAPEDPESAFHSYIDDHPILLDVYAEAVSKPRFRYPESKGPLGKAYVEPDFVLSYPDGRFRLVELERPSKGLATRSGQPRAEVGQSVFQIAEWRDYLSHHAHLVADRFPGLSGNAEGMIVISRSTSSRPADVPINRYLSMLRQQFRVNEILTYDDLVAKAREAVTRISVAMMAVRSVDDTAEAGDT